MTQNSSQCLLLKDRSLSELMLEQIASRSAVICVMGLGYVGLPLAMLFAEGGFRVIGYDTNDQYVQLLRNGQSSVCDVEPVRLQAVLSKDRFVPTSVVSDIGEADIYLICVPTPLAKTRQPDLSYIHAALATLTSIWKSGKMAILESTTYPGTTDEILLQSLSSASLLVDRDFLLAFSPERVDPGNREYPLETVPKVVGGVTPESTLVAGVLYETVFRKVHKVSNARVAELTKLLENTFRNINIAFVNEFAQICEALGVDVWEVIEAAKTKPFGFMAFYPGAGIGGHCIPLDPQYLVYRTRLEGYEPRLVALADQVNQEMPRYVCRRASEMLNMQKKAISGSRILVIGVAYKPNVPDIRESPTLWIMDYLDRQGALLTYCDPFVPSVKLGDRRLYSVQLSPPVIESSDLVIVITPHDSIDYRLLHRFRNKVLDTCNGLGRIGRITAASFPGN